MAHVKLPDGREFDIADGDASLEAYYRGEGATISKQAGDGPTSLPAVFDGEQYVDDASASDVAPLVQVPATGEPLTGYTVPPNTDGTFGPATLGPDGATAVVDGQTVTLQPDVPSGDAPVEQDPAAEADQPTDPPAKSTDSKS